MSDSENASVQHEDEQGRYNLKALFITQFSSTMTKQAIINTFSKFGEVESSYLNTSANFCIVNFKYAKDAKEAQISLNGTPPLNLKISFARKKKSEDNDSSHQSRNYNGDYQKREYKSQHSSNDNGRSNSSGSTRLKLRSAPHLTAIYKTNFSNASIFKGVALNNSNSPPLPPLVKAMCKMCGAAAQNVCGACKITLYCSEKCQKQDFHRHSADCSLLGAPPVGGAKQASNPSSSVVNFQNKKPNDFVPQEKSGGKDSFDRGLSRDFNKDTSFKKGPDDYNNRPNDSNIKKDAFDSRKSDGYRSAKNESSNRGPNDQPRQRTSEPFNKTELRNDGGSEVPRNGNFFKRTPPQVNGLDSKKDGFKGNTPSIKNEPVKQLPVQLVPKKYSAELIAAGGSFSIETETPIEGDKYPCVVLSNELLAGYQKLCTIDSSAQPTVTPDASNLVAVMVSDDWYRARLEPAMHKLWLVDAAKFIADTTPCHKLDNSFLEIAEYSAILSASGLKVGGKYEGTVKKHLPDGRIEITLQDPQSGTTLNGYLARYKYQESKEPVHKSPSQVTNASDRKNTPRNVKETPVSATSTPVAASVVGNQVIPKVLRPAVKCDDLVYMVHADEDHVFVRECSTDTEYNRIIRDVVLYGDDAPTFKTPPEIGEVVLSQFDGVFCRALLTRRNLSKDKYLVEYHDFGNTETTRLENLRPCTQAIAKEDVLVAKLKLSGVDSKMSTEALNWLLTKIVNEHKIVVRVVNGDIARLCMVSNNQCINDTVDKMSRPAWKEYIGTNLNELPAVMLSEINTVDLPLQGGELCVLDISLLQFGMVSCCPRDEPLIRQITKDLAEELKAYCESEIGQQPYTPRLEEVCVAKCPPNNQWFRAFAMERLENGQIMVTFLDYGNMATLGHEDIRRILPCHSKLPSLASVCTIVDFPEDEIKSPQLDRLKAALGFSSGAHFGTLRYKEATNTSKAIYELVAPDLLNLL